MVNYKLFVYRVGLIGITNLVLSLSGIILLPILTKNISIEEYGIWTQISVTINMLPPIVLLGFPYTIVRYLPSLKKKEDIGESFYTILFTTIITASIISSLLYIYSDLIDSLLFGYNEKIVKLIAAIIFVQCLNELFITYLRSTQDTRRYSLIVFMRTCLYIGLVAYFILTGQGIIGATFGILIKEIIIIIIISTYVIKRIGIRLPKFKNLKEYLKFGLPTVSADLSTWIVNSSDRYIIGTSLGNEFVGYYSPGYSLGNIIRMFIVPLSFILPPILSKCYDENDLNEVKKIMGYSIKYFLALSIPSVFGISLLSKPLLTILSTPEIASNGKLIVPFVSMSILFLGLFIIVQQIIILDKKTKTSGKIWIISAGLNVGLNLILIPKMGILGAAITTLLAFALSFLFAFRYCSKYCKLDIDYGFIFKSILSSCVMCLMIVKINPTTSFEIIYTIITCGIFYFVTIIFLKSFKKEEVEFFRSFLKHKT